MTQTFKFRVGLLLLLCSTSIFLASAADTSSTEATNGPDYLCGQAMLEQGGSLIAEYETFLNEFFQVDTPSSGQFEDALNEYRFIELSIQGIYSANLNIVTASSSGRSLADANAELTYCRYVRDSYLNYIQTLFQRQMLGSTATKVTFQVVDGLKAMNSNLDALAQTFGETFPTLFNKMNNDLPCYARSCTSK